MITSMTGYGRAEAAAGGAKLVVELRSVNHRYSEFSVRLPQELSPLEPRVKQLLQQRIARGSVTAVVSAGGRDDGRSAAIDTARAAQYLAQLRALKKELGIKGGVDLRTLLALPEVVSYRAETAAPDDGWELLSAALAGALARLEQTRKREGVVLERELRGRLQRMTRTVARIEARARTRPARYRRQLQARVKDIAENCKLDPARLAQEIALFADRVDITEELVRFRSHCAAFAAALRQPRPVGRRLDFLLQELNREANTIGSKANDAAVAQLAVGLKEQIEKMREQAQNVE